MRIGMRLIVYENSFAQPVRRIQLLESSVFSLPPASVECCWRRARLFASSLRICDNFLFERGDSSKTKDRPSCPVCLIQLNTRDFSFALFTA